MAEAIHPRPNMMTEVRTTRGEGEERIVDILVGPESLRDQQQHSVGTEESSKSLGTGRSQRPDAVSPTKCQIWAVVVLLGLLSVVMLARLIGLAVQHKKTASMDRDMEQLLQRLKNVTEQRDALLGLAVKYKTDMEKTVSMERDMEQLLLTLKNLTEQRDSVLCKQDCPDGWKKFGCKCYKTSDTLQSWNESREFCVSHGADLVVVDSKEEMDFIRKRYVYFWLGATDEAGEGTWRWVDGTVLLLDDPSWSGRGPQGGGDKNCLRRAFEQNQYKWTDEECERQRLGLCELNLMK
ncbi:unnamed protein product [Boreogadus saida]